MKNPDSLMRAIGVNIRYIRNRIKDADNKYHLSGLSNVLSTLGEANKYIGKAIALSMQLKDNPADASIKVLPMVSKSAFIVSHAIKQMDLIARGNISQDAKFSINDIKSEMYDRINSLKLAGSLYRQLFQKRMKRPT